jgi:DNA primase
MFPIHDESGRILGFGGRTLSSDKNIAKYVNSPESVVYHKSDVLYGLFQAKKHIQKENAAVLVEGYMDVITLHQNGIRNAVASSGTSLTEGQVKKLHRFCEKVIIAYDGDEAGKKAAERAVPMLLEEGLLVYRIGFPDNHDPDSYAKAFGRQALENHFKKNTIDFLEYYIEDNKEFIRKGPVERASFISRMAQWVSLIPDDIRRSVYVREVSKKLDIPEGVIQNEVSGQRKKYLKSKIVNDKADFIVAPTTTDVQDVPPEKKELLPVQHADETEILRLLLLYGNMILEEFFTDSVTGTQSVRQIRFAEYVLNALSYEQIMFSDPLHVKIFSLYFENFTENGAPGLQYFLNFPDEDIRNFITKHVIHLHQISENWKNFGIQIPDEYSVTEKAIRKSLLSLKEKILSQIIRSLKEDLKNDALSESDKIILLDKIRKLEKERMEINKNLGRSGIKFIAD